LFTVEKKEGEQCRVWGGGRKRKDKSTYEKNVVKTKRSEKNVRNF